MKRLKYILPVMLLMLLSIVTVEKAQAETLSGQAGDNAYWSYDTDTDTLSITGEGDLYGTVEFWDETYDIFKNTKVLKIGKNINDIGQYTFDALDPDNNVKVIIYGDTNNFARDSLCHVSTIVLHGSAENLGLVISGWPVKKIKVSSDNDKISIKNGMVMSADETTLYFYFGKRKKLTIPDTVETIREMAFASNETLSKVILGENVTTISDKAFYKSSIKMIVLNKKLRTIGTAAFEESKLKNISVLKNVKVGMGAFQYTKLSSIKIGKKVSTGIKAFSAKTTIIPQNNFRKLKVSITKGLIRSSGRVQLKWNEIEGAEGYEVVLKQGSKVKRWTQTSRKCELNDTSFKCYKKYFWYYGASTDVSYEDVSSIKNPIYVKVRAYKTDKNGNRIYSKWRKQILETSHEDEL